MKSCLYFSGSHKGVRVNQSLGLIQHRSVDLLWCVRTALPVVLGISVTDAGNAVEQCRALSVLPALSGQGPRAAGCCLRSAVGRTGLEGAELSGMLPEIVASASLLVCILSAQSAFCSQCERSAWGNHCTGLDTRDTGEQQGLQTELSSLYLRDVQVPWSFLSRFSAASRALLWLLEKQSHPDVWKSPCLSSFALHSLVESCPLYFKSIAFDRRHPSFLRGHHAGNKWCRHSHALLFLSPRIMQWSPSR